MNTIFNTIAIGNGVVDALFSANLHPQDQFETLANSALSRGIGLYQKGNYEAAVKEFRRSIALSPYSSYTQDAYHYMVQSLLKLDQTDEAIKAYQEAIRLDPTNESYHVHLGNIYFSVEKYDEALAEYKVAVRVNPTASLNWYSLGQAYKQIGSYTEAEQVFQKISSQSPIDAALGLGQTYRLMGRYEEAIFQLKSAIAMNKDLGYAYFELGLVYTDQKDFDKAQEQASLLSAMDQSLASQLSDYIYVHKSPRILAAYSTDFLTTYGPGTKLSDLNPSLSTPNASENFTIHFIFNKEMDESMITSPAYWSITRADGRNLGGAYNWSLPLPPTEVTVSPLPIRVIYNDNLLTADVTFRITQNASGDGTLDPSHLVFAFHGLDAYGIAMDPSADEYSGISLIV
ncbi:MAG: tetratricopeptide repeat protein [Thermodesulfobacteriota bacterium]